MATNSDSTSLFNYKSPIYFQVAIAKSQSFSIISFTSI